MKIHQIYTNSILRNFTYIIELNNNTAYVIDPWSDTQVNQFLSKNKLSLTAIINTHEHWDHICGNTNLVEKHNCEVWAHAQGKGTIPGLSRILTANETIKLADNIMIEVVDTPGHCQAHLCFMVFIDKKAKYIFTGDILFNAGVGRCDNGGNVSDLYTTIQEKFATLADDIIVLPGHEYLENNLKFTLSREPSNITAQKWLDKYNQSDIYTAPLTTTMADEREINTFLRLDNSTIINNLPNKPQNERDAFIALRLLRDKW